MPRRSPGVSATSGICEVLEIGIDTWRLTWPVESDESVLRSFCRESTRYGYKSRQSIYGYSVGWDPGSRMAWAEGHPAGVGRLAAPSSLDAWFGALDLILTAHGITMSSPVAIARLDTAATVQFADPSFGRAVLDGIGLLRLPRCKPEVHGHPNETIYFKGLRSQRKLCRIYDFGLLREQAERGRCLRFEEEKRYTQTRRRLVAAMTACVIKSQFTQRFAPLLMASHGISVLPPSMLEMELVARVRDGSQSARAAERMAGFVTLDRAGGCGHDARTRYRRYRELATNGLVAEGHGTRMIEFDLGSIFAQILGSPLWTCDG